MVALKSSLNFVSLLSAFLAYVLIVTTKGFLTALVAKKMGDPTAEREGYLSWNPLVHVDFIGAISLLFLGLGWGTTVPLDPRNIPNHGKLIITYLSGSFAYMVIAILSLASLLKVFGFKVLYVARQASSDRFIGLSQLSAAYPQYSSLILSCALVVIDIMYFSILFAAIETILQGFRLALILFFPGMINKKEADLILLLMPIVLLMIFFQPLINFTWSIVHFFGVLLGYMLGAS